MILCIQMSTINNYLQDREMKKYPAARREARPLGITAQYLEAMDEEPDYDDDLTATERARSDLAKGRRFDEAAEVREFLTHIN